MVYRVYDKENNKMIFDGKATPLLQMTNKGIFRLNPHYENGFYELIPYGENIIPMRGTGLQDKNSLEIFESDILKVFNNNTNQYETGVVVMSNLGCWSILFKDVSLKVPIFEFIDDRLSCVHDFSRIEIIGNIYTTPDLAA